MIVHDVEQGSGEWLALRAGKATASAFDKIVTPKWKVRTGDMPDTYAALLASERFCGMPAEDFSAFHADRGTMLEDDAIPWYEWMMGAIVERVGFITTNDGEIGCSPDGLVGEDGLVEIKCPAALSQSAVYVKCVTAKTDTLAAERYIAQVQGQLWITGRQWCDLVFYHPTLPKRIVRIERDEAACRLLVDAVYAVVDAATDYFERLQKMR